MITKITGQTPFQVLTNNFSISPSNEGYTLQISADGKQFSNLFSVGAGVTRLVTGVAANSYYRLLGNESEVVINWMKTCVTEGGSGGSGATYTAGDYIDITQDVISVTGITPDLYLTSADTENFLTSADTENLVSSAQVQTQIDASVSGKADAANVTENRAASRWPAWNSQGIITGTVGNIGYESSLSIDGNMYWLWRNGAEGNMGSIYAPKTAGSAGQILTPSGNTPVWVTPATINGSAITAGGNIEIQGGGADMSAYWTSAQTEEHIASAFTYINEVEQVTASAYTELHDGLMEVSARTVFNPALYTPTTGFATVNGSAITNGGNITIQGGGGGGISQSDLASSGYLYYDNGSTNLGNAVDYLKDEDYGKLVDYDHDGSMSATHGEYGNAPYPKHIVSIWQSDYDDMLDNHDYDIDSETLYIVLPDPCDEACECQKQGGYWDGIECHQ